MTTAALIDDRMTQIDTIITQIRNTPETYRSENLLPYMHHFITQIFDLHKYSEEEKDQNKPTVLKHIHEYCCDLVRDAATGNQTAATDHELSLNTTLLDVLKTPERCKLFMRDTMKQFIDNLLALLNTRDEDYRTAEKRVIDSINANLKQIQREIADHIEKQKKQSAAINPVCFLTCVTAMLMSGAVAATSTPHPLGMSLASVTAAGAALPLLPHYLHYKYRHRQADTYGMLIGGMMGAATAIAVTGGLPVSIAGAGLLLLCVAGGALFDYTVSHTLPARQLTSPSGHKKKEREETEEQIVRGDMHTLIPTFT